MGGVCVCARAMRLMASDAPGAPTRERAGGGARPLAHVWRCTRRRRVRPRRPPLFSPCAQLPHARAGTSMGVYPCLSEWGCGGARTFVTPMIMLLTCVHAVRIEAACFPDVNHRSTVTVLPSSDTERSIGRCERSWKSSPRGPLTVTCLHLTLHVTPSGTFTLSFFWMSFCEITTGIRRTRRGQQAATRS